MEKLWKYCKRTVYLLWKYCLFTVEVLWKYCGSTVYLLWKYFGSTLEVLWKYCGNTVEFGSNNTINFFLLGISLFFQNKNLKGKYPV